MRDRNLRIASYALGLLGLACAGYLTYVKYAEDGVCGVSSGCTVVQQSQWSELFGIPVSILGIVGYLGILTLLSLRGEAARLLLVIGTGIGFLFSCFLMYRAYITLEAFCPFCTTSAVVMTLLFLLSAVRFLLGPDRPSSVPSDDDGDADVDEIDGAASAEGVGAVDAGA